MLPNGGGIDQSALNTLAQVKLQQLSATPTQIGPFGESTVRWSVSGTATGVTVTLNGIAVDAAGSQLVQPLVTTPYTLAARAGPYTRTLGIIAVQVDLDACQIIPQPAGVLHTILSNFVRNVVLYPDSGRIRKTACQPRLKRFCFKHDPPRLSGQRIAPRPD